MLHPFTHHIDMHIHLCKALCTFPFIKPCVHMNACAQAPVSPQNLHCNAQVEIRDRRRISYFLPGNTGRYTGERKVPFVQHCNNKCYGNESSCRAENHDTQNDLPDHKPNLTTVPSLEKWQRYLKWPWVALGDRAINVVANTKGRK